MELLGKQAAWVLIGQGALAIVLGAIVLTWPGLTVAAFALVWGIYALVDGIGELALGATSAGVPGRGWLIFSGILGIVAGIIVVFNPFMSAAVLTWVLGIWLIVHGVFVFGGGFSLPGNHKWWVVVSGVLLVIAGAIFVANPAEAALSLAFLLGWLAIVWGIFCTVAGIALMIGARRVGSQL